MRAAGDFLVYERYKGDFTLQNARRRRKFLWFLSVTKGIFPYKMRAAGDFLWFLSVTRGILPYKMRAGGDFFVVSGRYKGDFPLQNERRRRKFCGFRALLGGFCVEKYDDILPKRERRGPKFPVLAKIPRSQISLIS